MMNWKHDDLAADLAIAIGPTPFLNVPLGSVWLAAAGREKDPQRADVVVVKPSYTQFCISIYEVKVSRSDYLQDVRADKWKGYMDHCHRIYFAAPVGMIKKDEVPDEAGLIVRGPSGWQVQKGAPSRTVEIPHHSLLSLLFAKQRTPLRYRQIDNLLEAFGKVYHWQEDKKKQARMLGKELADAYAKRNEYSDLSRDMQSKIRMTDYKIDAVDEFIRDSLDMKDRLPLYVYEIRKRLQELKKELEVDLMRGG